MIFKLTCGWEYPSCPGFGPHKRNNSSHYPYPLWPVRKNQHTITVYIVLTSMIKNISYPRSVVVYLSPLLIKLISHKPLFYSLKETTTTQIIKTPKTRIQKKDESLMITFLSHFTNKLQTKYTKPSTLTKTQRHIIESGKHIQTTQPVI